MPISKRWLPHFWYWLTKNFWKLFNAASAKYGNIFKQSERDILSRVLIRLQQTNLEEFNALSNKYDFIFNKSKRDISNRFLLSLEHFKKWNRNPKRNANLIFFIRKEKLNETCSKAMIGFTNWFCKLLSNCPFFLSSSEFSQFDKSSQVKRKDF